MLSIANVFAGSIFGGNPLCIFEDARGMSDESMQALTRQFNLSETTPCFLRSFAGIRVGGRVIELDRGSVDI